MKPLLHGSSGSFIRKGRYGESALGMFATGGRGLRMTKPGGSKGDMICSWSAFFCAYLYALLVFFDGLAGWCLHLGMALPCQNLAICFFVRFQIVLCLD